MTKTKPAEQWPGNNGPVNKVLTHSKASKEGSEIERGAGDTYINMKQLQREEEKKKLAEHVVEEYIDDLHSIAVDAGSTSQQIIEEMMEKRNFLSILTNNMTAFRQNSTQRVGRSANEFILTGGKYVGLFDALLGYETYTSFQLFNPNVVIIGVSGLIPDKGFFCHGNDEINIKKLLFMKDASTIIIPVDWAKLVRSDSYLFGEIADFKARDDSRRVVVTIPPSQSPGMDSKEFTESRKKYDDQVKKLRNKGIHVDEVSIET